MPGTVLGINESFWRTEKVLFHKQEDYVDSRGEKGPK